MVQPWGFAMMAMGVLMFIAATVRPKLLLYRAIEDHAAVLWKNWAARFLQLSGALITLLGLLWATGVIW